MEELTWRDLLAVVNGSRPGSSIHHALRPDDPQPEDVLAHLVEFARSMEYSQRWMQWSKTTEAEHGLPPEPYYFPWEPKPERAGGYSADSMTLQEALDFAGWTREMNER